MDNIEKIYSEYIKDVYWYLLSLSKDIHVAEEVTQETFFKVLKGIDKFKGECHVKVWIFKIAKNTYISYLKKSKRYTAERDVQQITETNIVENQLLKHETVFELHKKLHVLEEPYKEVFTLRVFCELPFGQIAELFNKTESWARVTYYRAKQKLKEDII